ncbi:hypothetical protein [Actinomadura parmotrematis]|uniref:Uncharacterized protein n=1 Tax=Actinomadura parmotrematis TaxID=2864039 RepID=A0ABS7G433_9ACTN|nr:hypothetical protein [Actinomadura parmotrematis]MBW8486413.1 hypothetical protein [Actinomadura parmotrematis]
MHFTGKSDVLARLTDELPASLPALARELGRIWWYGAYRRPSGPPG